MSRISLTRIIGLAGIALMVVGTGCEQNPGAPSIRNDPVVRNLQDIAFVSAHKAYVTNLEGNALLVIDPADGHRISTVDFSIFNTFAGTDSAEASPYMAGVVVSGDRVYVACQRLRTVQTQWGPSLEPGDVSKVVVVDAASDAIADVIDLARKNPVSMEVAAGILYVSCAGSWSDQADGGIERIALATNQNLGVCAEEADFGGTISNIVIVDSAKAYCAVGTFTDEFRTGLVEFNPSGGTVGAAVAGIDDAFGGAAFDGTRLFVGDRSPATPGIVVIDPTDNRTVSGPHDVGYPPSALVVNQTSVVAVTAAPDYSAGNMGMLQIAGFAVSKDLLSIHSDAVIRAYGGDVYVIERGVDRIIRPRIPAAPGYCST